MSKRNTLNLNNILLLPELHSIPHATVDGEYYYSAVDFLHQFYTNTPTNKKTNEIVGKVLGKKKTLSKSEQQQLKIQSEICKNSLLVLNFVAILSLTMSITGDKIELTELVEHLIKTRVKSSYEVEVDEVLVHGNEDGVELGGFDNNEDQSMESIIKDTATYFTDMMPTTGTSTQPIEEEEFNEESETNPTQDNALIATQIHEEPIATNNNINNNNNSEKIVSVNLQFWKCKSCSCRDVVQYRNNHDSFLQKLHCPVQENETLNNNQELNTQEQDSQQSKKKNSSFTDNDHKRSRQMLEVFQELLKMKNDNLHSWFTCLIETREGSQTIQTILKEHMSSPKYLKFQKLILDSKMAHAHDCLYMKDNNLLSMDVYHSIRKEGNLLDYLVTKALLQKAKLIFDDKVKSNITIKGVKEDYIGHIMDIEICMTYICQLYSCLSKKKLPSKVYFKLCIDGREISKKKQVAIALVPLNLRDVFPTQAVFSVFYIGLILMTESKDSLKDTVGEMADGIIKLNNNELFKLIYVSDMHNVGFTFEYDVCPWCDCTSLYQLYRPEKQSITGILPFQPINIFLCLLHLKQRMVENTIAYMASSQQHTITILENLRSLSGLKGFNWRELKQRYSEHNTPTTCDRATVKSSMLSGDQCNTILSNIDTILSGITGDTHETFKKILILLKNIIVICEKHENSSNVEKDITDDDVIFLEKLIFEFYLEAFDTWSIGVKSHYYHYLHHVPNMIRRLKAMGLSLSMISNQGFERSHLFHHSVFSRVINYGGGKKNYSMKATEQLLLWQWRKVFLALDQHERTGTTYWDEKRLRKAYKVSEEKKKCKKGLTMDPTIDFSYKFEERDVLVQEMNRKALEAEEQLKKEKEAEKERQKQAEEQENENEQENDNKKKRKEREKDKNVNGKRSKGNSSKPTKTNSQKASQQISYKNNKY